MGVNGRGGAGARGSRQRVPRAMNKNPHAKEGPDQPSTGHVADSFLVQAGHASGAEPRAQRYPFWPRAVRHREHRGVRSPSAVLSLTAAAQAH